MEIFVQRDSGLKELRVQQLLVWMSLFSHVRLCLFWSDREYET